MAKRKRVDLEKRDDLEKEARRKKRTHQPPNDQYKSADEGVSPAIDTILGQSIERHAALLADIHSDKQKADIVTQLQQSYGNAYVQRIMTRIQTEKGSGKPLESETRSEMEAAFGKDFSGVRIHTDAVADSLTGSLEAQAFTSGKDIFFKEGAFQTGSETGKELLAHELTHVVQQEGGIQTGRESVGREHDALEQKATQVGESLGQGHRVAISTVTTVPAIQLAPKKGGEEEKEKIDYKAVRKDWEVTVIDNLKDGEKEVKNKIPDYSLAMKFCTEAHESIDKIIEGYGITGDLKASMENTQKKIGELLTEMSVAEKEDQSKILKMFKSVLDSAHKVLQEIMLIGGKSG